MAFRKFDHNLSAYGIDCPGSLFSLTGRVIAGQFETSQFATEVYDSDDKYVETRYGRTFTTTTLKIRGFDGKDRTINTIFEITIPMDAIVTIFYYANNSGGGYVMYGYYIHDTEEFFTYDNPLREYVHQLVYPTKLSKVKAFIPNTLCFFFYLSIAIAFATAGGGLAMHYDFYDWIAFGASIAGFFAGIGFGILIRKIAAKFFVAIGSRWPVQANLIDHEKFKGISVKQAKDLEQELEIAL